MHRTKKNHCTGLSGDLMIQKSLKMCLIVLANRLVLLKKYSFVLSDHSNNKFRIQHLRSHEASGFLPPLLFLIFSHSNSMHINSTLKAPREVLISTSWRSQQHVYQFVYQFGNKSTVAMQLFNVYDPVIDVKKLHGYNWIILTTCFLWLVNTSNLQTS